ncbi:negative regulator of beta-lactamase [filamentous cyanobacterium CCP5]|nr:negative regulator of beta-lactamase [filamentous cyanobacterium CCP5]
MVKKASLAGLLGLLLVVVIGMTVRSVAAVSPLQPMVKAAALPTIHESVGQFLTPIRADGRSVSFGLPTDFAVASASTVAQSAPNYVPREEIALADPSNYGDRYLTDAYGRPIQNDFVAVLHETVGSARSAINLFQTHHPRDADQVSYHTLIARDGTVIYIVPPEKRAYGAGNSVFNGPNGPETVTTNPAFPPSINNFAYHVSLESPADGRGNSRRHSGYTQAQYESLAWLLARTDIPDNRITTHQSVDQSGSRMDPRSFDSQRFFALLRRYPTRVAQRS